MSRRFSKRCVRRGLTLIEVVAGIALLSTLLVAILVSYRAHAAQVRAAKRRLQVIDFADQQMATWMSTGRTPPIGKKGESTDGKYSWKIVRGEATTAKRLGLDVARLEVRSKQQSAGDTALATVEFLTLLPRREGQP